jgi:hypothetical protein
MELFRVSSYRVMQEHYIALGLSDTAAAIRKIPSIPTTTTDEQQATGTDDTNVQQQRPQYAQQRGCISQHQPATGCDEGDLSGTPAPVRKAVGAEGFCESVHHNAPTCEKAGDGLRTGSLIWT